MLKSVELQGFLMLSLENAVYQIVEFYALLARCHFSLVVLVVAEKTIKKGVQPQSGNTFLSVLLM